MRLSSSPSRANAVWPDEAHLCFLILFSSNFGQVVPREDTGVVTVAELDADCIVSDILERMDSNVRVVSVWVASGNSSEKIGFSRLFGTGGMFAQERRLEKKLPPILPKKGEGISHQLDFGR